jgi:hypothetical protein
MLRVPDEFAGKSARCPHCGGVSQAPEAPSPSGFQPKWVPPLNKKTAAADETDDEASPYQSPTTSGTAAPVSSVAAAEKVKAPGIALVVIGSIDVLLSIVFIGLQVFQIALFNNFQQGQQLFPMGIGIGINVVSSIISLVISGLMIYGGLQMMHLRSYALAMTAAILAIIPCFGACCLWDLPIGIWAVVILAQGDVQAAFRQNASA